MDKVKLFQFINKAFEYYDTQNKKYLEYIKSQKHKIDDEGDITIYSKINSDNTIITTYEILGILDETTNIFLWGWATNVVSNLKELSQNILTYGLSIDNKDLNEHIFLKSQLINSRILINQDIQLETILAIISYIIRDRIKFIYKIKNKSSIYYYGIK